MANPSPPDATTSVTGPSARQPIRVLVLDGGGVRGLSSLIILRRIMEMVAVAKDISPHHASSLRPAEYFDLVVGTGTGGLSALFLGRLRMTVDQAIAAYQQVTKAAFQPPSLISRTLQRSTSSRNLERCIGDIVQRFLNDRDALLYDPVGDSGICRTAVLACTSANTSAPPHVFRSYATSEPPSLFSILGVARAAITAAGMPAVSLGNPPVQFMSAGLVGYNNPAEVALQEASNIWRESHGRVDFLVSLGTGLQKLIHIGGRWKELTTACEQIAHSCEPVHRRMYLTGQDMNMEYFRFNVPQGLEVDLREWMSPDSSPITGITESYTRDPEVLKLLQSCVQTLVGRLSNVTSISRSPLGQGFGKVNKQLYRHLTDMVIIYRKYHSLHNPAPEIFHGRQDYVEQAIAMLLNQPAARLAILGPGGIGKTSIALTILHATAITSKFGEDSRFVSCEGITSTTILVDTLCTAFGLQNLSGDRESDLLVYLRHTYTSKSLLLILDNFETVWDVGTAKPDSEALLQRLGQVPLLSLIVTMRGTMHPGRVQWTRPFPTVVEKLDPAAARQVFMDIYGKNDDDKLDELLLALDYVPLAVTLMARLGSVFRPRELLETWDKEKTRMLSHPNDQGRLENVDVSIQISINSPRIQSTPVSLKLLSILALLPGGVHIDDLSDIAPALEGANLTVLTLVSVGLAQLDPMNMLHVLSPIRAYILQYHKPRPELFKDVQMYFFKLAELGRKNPGDVGYKTAVVTLKKVQSNMESILTAAINSKIAPEQCLQAALDWTNFLFWHTPRSDIIKLAVGLAEQEKQESQLAHCLYKLGIIQSKLAQYDEGQKTLLDAQTRFEILGEQLYAAYCMQGQGHILHVLYHNEQAQQMLSDAQTKFEVLKDQFGAAECLERLAIIQQRLHNYDKAQQMLSDAKARFEGIGHQLGVAQCLQSSGDIQYMLGNYNEAQQVISSAQTMFETLGDKVEVAKCLGTQGNMQYMLGHYDVALEMVSNAQTMFKTLGSKSAIAQSLRTLGNIQGKLKHYDEAQQMLSDALSWFEAIGDQFEVAYCLSSLGYISEAQKRVDQAIMHFTQAKEKYTQVGSHTQAEQDGCTRALNRLAPH